MLKGEFIIVLRRLEECFSSYNEAKIDYIWRAVNNLEMHEFEKVINNLISTKSSQPVIAAFYEEARMIRKTARIYAAEGDPSDREPDCIACLDLGLNYAAGKVWYFVRCTCPKGEQHDLPAWSEKMAIDFELKSLDGKHWKPSKSMPLTVLAKKWTKMIEDSGKYWRER